MRLVGLLGAFLAVTCIRSSGASEGSNVILITIDTLRADHVGCYGYNAIKTPNIDRLAEQGTRFVNAYTQVPYTLPSHAALFTSTYPMWNGVRDPVGPPLPLESLTLAEVLRQNGYATGGFPDAFVLDGYFQLNQGFDYYYDHFPRRDDALRAGKEAGLVRHADEQLKLAFEWMNKNLDRKFFVWLHLYDPHHPYNPPEPYRSQYPNRPYDAEIAYVDSAIGKLVDFLAVKKLRQKTLIVLTADLGEALGDHQESYHGYYVYDTTIKVPLIVEAPNLATVAKEVKWPVDLVDVAPTVLQLVGIPIPQQMQGRSLLTSILGKGQGAEPIYGESLFAHLHFGWGELHCLRVGRYKLIQSPKPELFDLEKDPGESANIYAKNLALATTMRHQLEEIAAKHTRKQPARAAPRLTQEALNNLRALGYIGAPSDAAHQMTGSLADPKDRIQLYNLYLEGGALEGAGKLEGAAATFRKILAVDPTPAIVHHQLGSLYFKMGDYEKAVESFKAAIQRNERDEASLLALARTYGEMGKFKEAIAGYERALTLNPEDSAALNNIAVALMKLGAWQRARETLELAVRQSSPLKESFYHLGVCYQREQRLDQATAQFRKAVEMDDKFAAAHYDLGAIFARQGQQGAAIEEFKKASAARPDFAEPHFNLGALYARSGDLKAAAAELQKAIQIRPDFAEAYYNLGTVYGMQAQWDNAIAQYKKAVSIRPDFAKAYHDLAVVYQQKGMAREASAALEAEKRTERSLNSDSKASESRPALPQRPQ
jgi:arylsulfatase A-like enzyme/Tfp pilus assembly protein PilF